ncbi:hypothetical protein R9X44_16785 [Actinocorallia sp. A-T 12471]|nr:hypothetical protein [Actinocorallia sp. A-T 12471]MDX6741447.1 hypothetical protein [Actinocorallia sp. A-T 12471]
MHVDPEERAEPVQVGAHRGDGGRRLAMGRDQGGARRVADDRQDVSFGVLGEADYGLQQGQVPPTVGGIEISETTRGIQVDGFVGAQLRGSSADRDGEPLRVGVAARRQRGATPAVVGGDEVEGQRVSIAAKGIGDARGQGLVSHPAGVSGHDAGTAKRGPISGVHAGLRQHRSLGAQGAEGTSVKHRLEARVAFSLVMPGGSQDDGSFPILGQPESVGEEGGSGRDLLLVSIETNRPGGVGGGVEFSVVTLETTTSAGQQHYGFVLADEEGGDGETFGESCQVVQEGQPVSGRLGQNAADGAHGQRPLRVFGEGDQTRDSGCQISPLGR